MKKSLFILITAILLSVVFCCFYTASAETYGDLTYYNANGGIEILGCDMSATSVTIPGTIEGYPVLSIAEYAFYHHTNLTSVVIPDTVNRINEYAFYGCSNLQSVFIPDSVRHISELYTFDNCPKLTFMGYEGSYAQAYANGEGIPFTVVEEELNIVASGTCGENLTWTLDEVGTLTISGNGDMTNWGLIDNPSPWLMSNKIKNIVVSDGVTSIGDNAFLECGSVLSVTLGNDIRSIGVTAFQDCVNLSDISLPEGLTTIKTGAFAECKKLQNIILPESITVIGGSAFSNCVKLNSLTIPQGVTSIDNSTFFYCKGLTNIVVPEGITSIGNKAFYYCENLTSITIPKSVTSIGKEVFDYCKKLKSINVNNENEYYTSQDGVLFTKDKTTLIKCPTGNTATSYTLPQSVITIGEGAFRDCAALTAVQLLEGVHNIEKAAFAGCSNITDFVIPNSVTTLGSHIFSACRNLTGVTVSNKVESIGEYTFWECNSLNKVIIPRSITSIGNNAFGGCGSFSIHGHTGSFAQEYAESNNIPFAVLSDELPPSEDTMLTIYADNANGRAGDTVNVPVKIEGNPGIALLSFRVKYDSSAMKLIGYTAGEVFGEGDITAGNLEKNPYAVSALCGSEDKTDDGTVITLTFEILDDCVPGEYSVEIIPLEVYNLNEQSIDVIAQNGTVTTFEKIIYGDVTGDGEFNRNDLLRLAKYFADWDVEIDAEAADVTRDGILNRKDLLRLAKYFAGWDVAIG
ncbi:MAG: leucine-rich repeat protein [Clostridia bacterium]|nr:leucine-rich repeat protein [Clostridia bacterium]